MARTDVYPVENLSAIKTQLPRFFAAFGEKPPGGGGASHGVAESFQVWTVPLQVFRLLGAAGASWNQVWHHQIRQPDGTAEAFAHSLDAGVPEVRAVYRSPLAQEIDHAIERIDEHPILKDDGFIVRLLEVPDLHFMTIWILRGVTSQYIPLGKFASGGEQRFNPISTGDLVARLPVSPIIGLSQAPPPDRRPDFV